MLYMRRLGFNAAEATKNICYMKGEGAVDQTVEYVDNSINFSLVARISTMRQSQVGQKLDSKALLKAMEANLMSSTWRVSGELDISQYTG